MAENTYSTESLGAASFRRYLHSCSVLHAFHSEGGGALSEKCDVEYFPAPIRVQIHLKQDMMTVGG